MTFIQARAGVIKGQWQQTLEDTALIWQGGPDGLLNFRVRTERQCSVLTHMVPSHTNFTAVSCLSCSQAQIGQVTTLQYPSEHFLQSQFPVSWGTAMGTFGFHFKQKEKAKKKKKSWKNYMPYLWVECIVRVRRNTPRHRTEVRTLFLLGKTLKITFIFFWKSYRITNYYKKKKQKQNTTL